MTVHIKLTRGNILTLFKKLELGFEITDFTF